MDRGSAGQIGDHEIGAVLVAGETDWGDPRGALMDEKSEEQEMQHRGRGSILWATAECGDWFANSVDACLSVAFGFCCFVQAG